MECGVCCKERREINAMIENRHNDYLLFLECQVMYYGCCLRNLMTNYSARQT
jgi:hypothetical protein